MAHLQWKKGLRGYGKCKDLVILHAFLKISIFPLEHVKYTTLAVKNLCLFNGFLKWAKRQLIILLNAISYIHHLCIYMVQKSGLPLKTG